jgi:hypothetical protein
MLTFIDDKSEDVATFVLQVLGHQSYSTPSDQAVRNGLGKPGNRGTGRRGMRWACQVTGPARNRQGE